MVSFTRTYFALGLLAATATANPQAFKMKFTARPILIREDEIEATQWKTAFLNAMKQPNWVETGYTRYQQGDRYWEQCIVKGSRVIIPQQSEYCKAGGMKNPGETQI